MDPSNQYKPVESVVKTTAVVDDDGRSQVSLPSREFFPHVPMIESEHSSCPTVRTPVSKVKKSAVSTPRGVQIGEIVHRFIEYEHSVPVSDAEAHTLIHADKCCLPFQTIMKEPKINMFRVMSDVLQHSSRHGKLHPDNDAMPQQEELQVSSLLVHRHQHVLPVKGAPNVQQSPGMCNSFDRESQQLLMRDHLIDTPHNSEKVTPGVPTTKNLPQPLDLAAYQQSMGVVVVSTVRSVFSVDSLVGAAPVVKGNSFRPESGNVLQFINMSLRLRSSNKVSIQLSNNPTNHHTFNIFEVTSTLASKHTRPPAKPIFTEAPQPEVFTTSKMLTSLQPQLELPSRLVIQLINRQGTVIDKQRISSTRPVSLGTSVHNTILGQLQCQS